MKNQTILLLLAGAIIAFFSCKKPPAPAASLVGNWVVSKEYIDVIGNGNFSTAQLVPDSLLSNQTVQFSSNGTFTEPGIVTGGWKLIDNNTYLEVTDTSSGSTLNTYDAVLTLTSTTLELKDTTGASYGPGNITWVFFTKQ